MSENVSVIDAIRVVAKATREDAAKVSDIVKGALRPEHIDDMRLMHARAAATKSGRDIVRYFTVVPTFQLGPRSQLELGEVRAPGGSGQGVPDTEGSGTAISECPKCGHTDSV